MAAPALQAAGAALGGRALPRLVAAAALGLLGLLLLIVAPLALLSSIGGSGPTQDPERDPGRRSCRSTASRRAPSAQLARARLGARPGDRLLHEPDHVPGAQPGGLLRGPVSDEPAPTGRPRPGTPTEPPSGTAAVPRATRIPQTPHPSVYDDFDAAMAAGSLLHANGADSTLAARTWNAVRAYNGSGPVAVAYADAVMNRARAWAQSPPTGTGLSRRQPARRWSGRCAGR